MSPLIGAVLTGRNDTVELLLHKGAPVKPPTVDGDSLLLMAAVSGHLNFRRLLIDRGASFARNNSGFTPLIAAATRDHDIMATLDNNGVTPPVAATARDHDIIAKTLLSHHDGIGAVNVVGVSALRLPALNGQENLIKILIEFNANVNATGFTGETALHRAAQKGHVSILSLLVAVGADPNAFTMRGSSAFATAAAYDQVETAERMAGFGADAVLIARGSKHLDTVRMLLSHGAHNEPGSDYEVGPRLLDERVLGQLKSWIDTCAVIALENRPEIVEFIKHVRKRLDATIEDNKRRALEEMGIGSGEEDKRLGHDEKAAVKRVDTAPEPAALGFIVL
ncbi:hypothetical protein ABVK25_007223 [Lepraria finkii]|uniref:Ankyrin n=1 Tax=Lepraria finkii TaxID=1340010 RepID=A0ABR4B462_9LECA